MPPPIPAPDRCGRAGGAKGHSSSAHRQCPQRVPLCARGLPSSTRGALRLSLTAAGVAGGPTRPAPTFHGTPTSSASPAPPPAAPRGGTAASLAFSPRASRAPREEKQGKGVGLPG